MPTNLILMKENPEALKLSQDLGFTKTLFLDKDFILIKEKKPQEILKKIKEAKNRLVVVKPENEDLLRFVLEKTQAKLIFGQELINKSDSLHFPRGGLDQILCKIAKEKNKVIAFSFSDLLEAEDKPKLLNRLIFNLKLCQKYSVKVFFSNFSENLWQMRSASDLKAFSELLGENRKESLEL